MIDHATQERRAWLRVESFPKAARPAEKPPNWLLAVPITAQNDTIDAEYQARADRAWAKTRAIGGAL